MATPKQFDVFENPIARARRAFPFVVLQSPLADTGRERVVAPLVPTEALPPFAGRLMPVVEIAGRGHAVLIPSLTAIRAEDLRRPVASIERETDRVTAAIDFLFFGI